MSLNRNKAYVLLIEDNKMIKKIQTALLENLGCRVDAVDSGHDAICLWQQHHYDIAFVDIGLPDMDGFSVIDKVRELNQPITEKTIIVILSANADKEYRERASTAGVQYMVKPLIYENARIFLDQLSRSS